MDDSIRAFQEHLNLEGKAPKTIESYLSDVNKFSNFLKEHLNKGAQGITRKEILAFRQHILDQNYRPATINKAVNSLHAFTNWMITSGRLPGGIPLVRPAQDRIKIAVGSDGEVEVLKEEEYKRLVNWTINSNGKVRDSLIVNYLLFTGVRVNELVNIKLSNLDMIARELAVLGKGNKYREIPLKPELVEQSQEYIKGERKDSNFNDSPFLFVSQRSGKLDRDTVNTILNKIGQQLNMKLYPHKLRHTFCTRLIAAGVPVTTVSKLAGHAGVDTTVRYYINVGKAEKANAVNRL